MNKTIREFSPTDIDLMIHYFLEADSDFLRGMGVESSKLPQANAWKQMLQEDLEQPIQNKKFYYVAWELDGQPVGHSNINKIIFGQEACMHLHLWDAQNRKSGHGIYFVHRSIDRYFKLFELKNLICEPYSMNPGPNKTLPKVGFELIKTYQTTPGWINFEQPVNRWVLSREKWLQLSS